MSTEATKTMIAAYLQNASPTMFLSSFFNTPRENFFASETVEVDIVRTLENVAIAVTDLSTGYRVNATDLYTNKEFTPAIYKEKIAINSTDLLKRNAGSNPFERLDYRAAVIDRFMDAMLKIERKIRRAIELQAAQVLQTGKLDLKDENGVTIYELDFKPKATHFPTAGTAWDNPASTKAADIDGLEREIRKDGQRTVDEMLMGSNAFRLFVDDSAIREKYDTRRLDQGTIAPMRTNSEGGQYRGTYESATTRFDIWTYDGQYVDAATGNVVPYLDPNSVVMRSSSGRMDLLFGDIPNIGRELGMQRALGSIGLPARFGSTAAGIDLHTNIWLPEDGEQIFGGIGTRALCAPTAIDTYGCLTVI